MKKNSLVKPLKTSEKSRQQRQKAYTTRKTYVQYIHLSTATAVCLQLSNVYSGLLERRAADYITGLQTLKNLLCVIENTWILKCLPVTQMESSCKEHLVSADLGGSCGWLILSCVGRILNRQKSCFCLLTVRDVNDCESLSVKPWKTGLHTVNGFIWHQLVTSFKRHYKYTVKKNNKF